MVTDKLINLIWSSAEEGAAPRAQMLQRTFCSLLTPRSLQPEALQ